MATATALDPATELEQQVQTVSGVRPLISIADDVALVSYRLPGEVLTQVAARRWRLEHARHRPHRRLTEIIPAVAGQRDAARPRSSR